MMLIFTLTNHKIVLEFILEYTDLSYTVIFFFSNSKYNKDFYHNIQYTRKNAGRMAGPIGKPIN